MTQTYALFFDIDGTLVSFKTHEIPQSTIQALTQAKANGSRVYIATGRPPLIITNLGAIEPLIDGYITTNGALCYVGTEASPLDEVLQQDILQLTPFFPTDYEPELMARMPQCVSGRWHPEFTDITANGADKGKGILAMARHEGFDVSRTIAFGDGGNDTSMIIQAGIGVAMGNAIEELKQQADYITTSVDDNGILNALRHLHVI